MRVARDIVPGVFYHLIARFVDRKWFFTNDDERRRYLALLGNALGQCDWTCLAYALMSNHIHLAMIAGTATLESWTKRVHSPFAIWMNERRKRIGNVFVRGPKAIAVLPENEGKVIAYIHNNPVRAGVVSHASDSTWTSHRLYVGLAKPQPWLNVSEGLRRVGLERPEDFDAWVNATPGESGEVDLRRVRKEARKRGAIEVATPTIGPNSLIPIVVRPHAHVRMAPRRIVQIAAAVLGLTELDVCSSRREERITTARLLAVHAAFAAGLSGPEIASCIGVSPQAVSHLRKREVVGWLQECLAIVLARVFDEERVRSAS
jgi:putative transposase